MKAQLYDFKISGHRENTDNELAEFLLAYEKFVKKYGKRYAEGTLAHLQNELRESEARMPVF